MLDRMPNQSLIYGFILMPIDMPGGGDSPPVNLPISQKQILRQPPRRFRDNLKCANHRVNRLSVGARSLEVESRGEITDRIDIVNDVRQPLRRILRRHEPCRAMYWPGAMA